MKTSGSIVAAGLVCLGVCAAAPSRHLLERATHLTTISQLLDKYDYVIVGGGAAGLTVADRLTEDAKSTTSIFSVSLIHLLTM